MGGFTIRYLVALARSEREAHAISQCCFQVAFEAEEYVSLGAPVVGGISGGIFDHAHADLAEILGSPNCQAGLSGVLGRSYLSPIRGREREPGHLHRLSIFVADGRKFGAMAVSFEPVFNSDEGVRSQILLIYMTTLPVQGCSVAVILRQRSAVSGSVRALGK